MNPSAFFRGDKRWAALVLPAFFVGAAGIGFITTQPQEVVAPTPADVPAVVAPVAEQGPVRLPLPKEVRGLYWTAQTAGTALADQLIAYATETGLNAVVVDLKADNGEIAFTPKNEALAPYAMNNPLMADMEAVVKKLGDAELYRIARLAVMRDSAFAAAHPEASLKNAGGGLWRDKTGSAWLDPASPVVADTAIALAREAYARGFDEIQLDYVRFPSDGVLSRISYPVFKQGEQEETAVMRAFFEKVGGTLQTEGIPVSADLFGMTYWQENDFGIGQRLADVLPFVDFVSPMAYPSHYPDGFRGHANPATAPYDIVKSTVDEGAALVAPQGFDPAETRRKTRVWIQDFDIGAVYTAELIEAQIKAVRDAGASGWMLWNARNVYEPANYRE